MVDPNTRQGKRTPVTLKIKFKSETLEQFIERYAVDVSQGGIFIRTKEPLAVGTQMRFEFQLRDASPLIAGEGTVVWTRENDPSRPAIAPGMGVRFDRLAEGSQTVLERILSEKAKQAPTRPAETTKPPMFTDTPTRVAPAPVQEALLGEERNSGMNAVSRPSGGFGDQQTPLPKPVPFHSDAEDFDEQAFEEATKVRAVDELVAQSALDDNGAKSVPRPASSSAPPVSKPIDSPAAEESRRVSANLPAVAATDAGGPIDRDSAPSLPNPPKVDSTAAKAPRLLDTTPSPRTEAASAAPALDTPGKTKLGVEPARPNTPTNRPANRSVSSAVDDNESAAYPSKKSSAAPMVILVLFVLAAAAAGVWFFFLREKAKPAVVATGSGSALVDTGSGSAGAMVGSGSAMVDVGSGSGSADVGSGSQMANGSNTAGSGSAVEAPKGPTVDTVIAASTDKATIEVIGTDQSGPAPFTAKLEKDKAYQVKVSAPGYLPTTLDLKGGAAKQTAKLAPKPKKVEVTSTPDTALIYIDGRPTGMATPKTIDIPKDKLGAKSIRISIRKQGWKPVEKTLTAAAFTEADDVMTAKIDSTLEKAAVVVPRPPTGSGSAAGSGAGSAAAGSGSASGGSEGSGSTGGGSSTPPPPPPPDEPEPNL